MPTALTTPGSSEAPKTAAGGVAPLVGHWNGDRLASARLSNPAGRDGYATLSDVSATSPTDVWAAGTSSAHGTPVSYHTLVEHYDGESWQVMDTPSPSGTSGSLLEGIDAVSPTDVWAVGEPSCPRCLIEHWDGVSWSILPSPAPGPPGSEQGLSSVTATSADDAWAVGWFTPKNPDSSKGVPVEHWDGSSADHGPPVGARRHGGVHRCHRRLRARRRLGRRADRASAERLPHVGVPLGWSHVGAHGQPQPWCLRTSTTCQMSARCASDVWAVGTRTVARYVFEPLILHWDGSTWSSVRSAAQHEPSTDLRGVSADSSDDVWAVGYDFTAIRPVVERWQGSQWSGL